MGAASKALSVILRIWELCCAAIVAGIVGHYLHILNSANVHAGSRVVYTIVIAGISILFSIILMPPLKYSFYCFLIDAAIFICWMVAFGLMDNVRSPIPNSGGLFCGFGDNVYLQLGGGNCSSRWYWSSWGYYWGGFWRTVPLTSATQSLIGRSACSQWRAALAFMFIGGWTWIISMILVSSALLYILNEEQSINKLIGNLCLHKGFRR